MQVRKKPAAFLWIPNGYPGEKPLDTQSAIAAIANVDALPAEQPRVHRPGAGSEQREAAADRRQQDVNPRVARIEDEICDLKNDDERTRDRCPQSRNQEETEPDLNDEDRGGRERDHARQAGGGAHDHHPASDEPHEKQACAWQTSGECGK